MAGFGSLSAPQARLLAALLAAPSLPLACQHADVPERTARHWLKDPAFADAYRDAKKASLDQAVGRLQVLSSAAVAVLQQVMVDQGTPAAVRVQAAGKVLDVAMKAQDGDHLEDRLAAMEAALAGELGPRAIA